MDLQAIGLSAMYIGRPQDARLVRQGGSIGPRDPDGDMVGWTAGMLSFCLGHDEERPVAHRARSKRFKKRIIRFLGAQPMHVGSPTTLDALASFDRERPAKRVLRRSETVRRFPCADQPKLPVELERLKRGAQGRHAA